MKFMIEFHSIQHKKIQYNSTQKFQYNSIQKISIQFKKLNFHHISNKKIIHYI